MVVFTLSFFSVQQIIGASGILLWFFDKFHMRYIVDRLSFGKISFLYRVNNTLGGPTGGGHIAVILLAIFMIIFLAEQKQRLRFLLGRENGSTVNVMSYKPWELFLIIVSISACVLTFSRSVVIEVGVVSIVFFVLFFSTKSLNIRDRIIRIFGIVTITCLLFTILPAFVTRITDPVRTDRERKMYLDTAWQNFKKNMFFGTGFGTSVLRSIPSQHGVLLNYNCYSKNKLYYSNMPHNAYMMLCAELSNYDVFNSRSIVIGQSNLNIIICNSCMAPVSEFLKFNWLFDTDVFSKTKRGFIEVSCDAYNAILLELSKLNFLNNEKVDYYLGAPHNSYLVFLNELGVFGTLIVFGLFAIFLCFRCLWFRGLVKYTFFATLIGMFFTETIIFFPKFTFAFAFLFWVGFMYKENGCGNERQLYKVIDK